jgi:hypothetical protein
MLIFLNVKSILLKELLLLVFIDSLVTNKINNINNGKIILLLEYNINEIIKVFIFMNINIF